MKIKVTQEDIDKGKKLDPNYCPIALACKRHWGGKVGVSGTTINVWLPSGFVKQSFALPNIARFFIFLFDKDRPVEPFEFEVE